jgi:chaperonin GroES
MQTITEELIFTPMGDNLLVSVLDREQRTKSGIILPEAVKDPPLLADVLSVGPRVRGVIAGDRILYQRYSGTEVKTGDRPALLIMSLDDVLAVVGKAKPASCAYCGSKRK